MRIVHIASSQRLCRVKAKDGQIDAIGCIRLFYLNFAIFIMTKRHFNFLTEPINRT
jgi:hypothetical protein